MEDIRTAKMITRPLTDDVVARMSVKKKIETADITLAIIDEKFSENEMLNNELHIALMAVYENRNHLVLPIVLGNAAVPLVLKGILNVRCDSKSNEDLYETKQKIERVLKHKKYNIKNRNLIERRSRTSSMMIITIASEILAVLFILLFGVLINNEASLNIGYFDDERLIIPLLFGFLTVALSILTLFVSYVYSIFRRLSSEGNTDLDFVTFGR